MARRGRKGENEDMGREGKSGGRKSGERKVNSGIVQKGRNGIRV